jgi:hypothetical protein
MEAIENLDKAIGSAIDQLEANSSVFVELLSSDGIVLGKIHVSHNENLPSFEDVNSGGDTLSMVDVNEYIESETGLKIKFYEDIMLKVAEDFGLPPYNFYGAPGKNAVAFFNGQYAVSFTWGEDDADENS